MHDRAARKKFCRFNESVARRTASSLSKPWSPSPVVGGGTADGPFGYIIVRYGEKSHERSARFIARIALKSVGGSEQQADIFLERSTA